MNTPLTLAAAQTVPVRGDVDANMDQHLLLVRAGAAEHVDVVVFPELSLTGYELDLASELAFSENDTRLSPLRNSADEHDMTLVVGAPLRRAGIVHIAAFIVGPNRSLDVYTKRHLGSGEERWIEPGILDPLLQLDDFTASVAVCADANHASHPKAAADRGARTYLVSSFIEPQQFDERTAALREYAVRHRMAVVFSNYGGPTGGLATGGRSSVWSGKGEVLARAGPAGVGLAAARVRV